MLASMKTAYSVARKGAAAEPKRYRRLLDTEAREGVKEWAVGFGDIPPYWCDHCGPIWSRELGVANYRPATLWQPEEGDDCCPQCGRLDPEGPELGLYMIFRARRKNESYSRHRERMAETLHEMEDMAS